MQASSASEEFFATVRLMLRNELQSHEVQFRCQVDRMESAMQSLIQKMVTQLHLAFELQDSKLKDVLTNTCKTPNQNSNANGSMNTWQQEPSQGAAIFETTKDPFEEERPDRYRPARLQTSKSWAADMADPPPNTLHEHWGSGADDHGGLVTHFPTFHELHSHHLHSENFGFQREMLKKHLADRHEKHAKRMKPIRALSHPSVPKAPRSCYEFVHGRCFSFLCSVLTFANAVVVGVETDVQMRAYFENRSSPRWIVIIATLANLSYIIEIVIRVLTDGLWLRDELVVSWYFIGPNWRWNWFDVVLVAFSIFDTLGDGISIGFLRMFRATRIVRAFRVVRVLRLFGELRLLVASILTSMMSLLWSIMFLFLLTYLTSVAVMQGAVLYVQDNNRSNSQSDTFEQIERYWGSLPKAMYMLAASITGGVDWTDVAEPLWTLGWGYGTGFMMFVLASVMGIMNVITGVFVENASNVSKIDRDFAITRHLSSVDQDVKETVALFNQLDTEGAGEVSVERLKEFFTEPRVIAYFSTMELDVSQIQRLAGVFDSKGDGVVTQEDFVVGCIGLRGAAKKCDIRLTEHTQSAHLTHVEKHIMKLCMHLAKDAKRLSAGQPARNSTSHAQDVPSYFTVDIPDEL